MKPYTSKAMNKAARDALSAIGRCLEADRIRLTLHFRVRLAERGVLWPDVLTVFDKPDMAKADGFDDAGRARWIVGGKAADGEAIKLVCAVGRDDAGELTVFITAFWEK